MSIYLIRVGSEVEQYEFDGRDAAIETLLDVSDPTGLSGGRLCYLYSLNESGGRIEVALARNGELISHL